MFFAEGVSKSFGGLDVLEDVSLVVGTGERVGLVGPNGAGKTTLLRLLAGQEDADAGQAGHRGSLGYLRQEAGLDSNRALVDELWSAFPEERQVEERLMKSPRKSSRAKETSTVSSPSRAVSSIGFRLWMGIVSSGALAACSMGSASPSRNGQSCAASSAEAGRCGSR